MTLGIKVYSAGVGTSDHITPDPTFDSFFFVFCPLWGYCKSRAGNYLQHHNLGGRGELVLEEIIKGFDTDFYHYMFVCFFFADCQPGFWIQ